MSTLYYLSADNSDLSGGADFNKKLVTSGETSGTQSLSFTANQAKTSYGFTEPGLPGTLGQTGNYTVTVNIPTTNAQGRLAISLSRVNSAGTVQSTSASTAEQTTNSATLTFSLTSINLGTWSAGDRLRVNYEFRNNNNMTQAWAIGFGTVSSVDAPFAAAQNLEAGVTCTATVTGDLTFASNPQDLEGDINVSAATTGALSKTAALAGAPVASANVVGAIVKDIPLSGSASCVVNTTAGLTVAIIVTAPYTGRVNGFLVNQVAVNDELFPVQFIDLEGDLTCTATTTGLISIEANLEAAVTCTAATTGLANADWSIAGDLLGEVTTTGLANAAWSIAGDVLGEASTTGLASVEANLEAAVTCTATTTGLVGVATDLEAAVTCTAATTGLAVSTRPLAGAVSCEAISQADLLVDKSLLGAVQGVALASGALFLTKNLDGVAITLVTTEGKLSRVIPLFDASEVDVNAIIASAIESDDIITDVAVADIYAEAELNEVIYAEAA